MKILRARCIAVLALLVTHAATIAWANDSDWPRSAGRVTDEANIITPGTVSELQKLLSDHETKTSNLIFVVTLASLRGNDIENAAREIGRLWNMDVSAEARNGLFVVSPAERKVRVHLGEGLRASLTDAKVTEIIDGTIVPHFRAGRFELGILDGVRMIVVGLENRGTGDELDAGSILFFSLAAGAVFLVFVNIRRRRRRRAAGDTSKQRQDREMQGDSDGGNPGNDGDDSGSGGGSGGW